jgi:hypothetical protein
MLEHQSCRIINKYTRARAHARVFKMNWIFMNAFTRRQSICDNQQTLSLRKHSPTSLSEIFRNIVRVNVETLCTSSTTGSERKRMLRCTG